MSIVVVATLLVCSSFTAPDALKPMDRHGATSHLSATTATSSASSRRHLTVFPALRATRSANDLYNWGRPFNWGISSSAPSNDETPLSTQPPPDSAGCPPSGLAPGEHKDPCRASNISPNALFGGQILEKVREVKNANECCRLCSKNEQCNAWAWCRNDGRGQGCLNSLSSGWRHPPEMCLLKVQERLNSNPDASPTVLMSGDDVPWTSGRRAQGPGRGGGAESND